MGTATSEFGGWVCDRVSKQHSTGLAGSPGRKKHVHRVSRRHIVLFTAYHALSGKMAAVDTDIEQVENKSVQIPLEQRLEIVKQLESGASVNRLASEYNLHPNTVRRFRRNAASMCQLSEQGAEDRKNPRKPANEELDNHLYAWFQEQRAEGQQITDAILVERATQFNRDFGGPSSFKASRGWLWKFKTRFGIRLPHVSNDNDDVAIAAIASQFADDFVRRVEEEEITYENVYFVEDSGLLWRALPMDTNAERKRWQMERVTVGLCANATGRHKLAPLFIHKKERPRALKHCSDRLPVIFKHQPRAWMDQKVFDDWYLNHFKGAVRAHQLETRIFGKVFLVVGNFRGNTLQVTEEMRRDDQFEIILLPTNANSVFDPIDQDVVELTKTNYRRKMLQRLLNYARGIQEFYFDYDLKDCMDLFCEAWSEITDTALQGSWRNIIKKGVDEVKVKDEPQDPLEPNLQDIIGVMNEEPVSEDNVNEFLARCTEEENNFVLKAEDDEEDEDDDEGLPSGPILLDEDQLRQTFENLMIWSKGEPEYIKELVDFLKDYYDRFYQ